MLISVYLLVLAGIVIRLPLAEACVELRPFDSRGNCCGTRFRLLSADFVAAISCFRLLVTFDFIDNIAWSMELRALFKCCIINRKT